MDKTNDVPFVKEYLKWAFVCEKNVYMWSQAMENANNKIRSIYNQRTQLQQQSYNNEMELLNNSDGGEEKKKEQRRLEKKYGKYILILVVVAIAILAGLFLIGLVAEDGGPAFGAGLLFIYFPFFGVPLTVALIILISKKKKARYLATSDSISNAARRNTELLSFQNQSINTQLTELDSLEQNIKYNQKVIHNCLLQAKEDLVQHYSQHVIPPKYQSLIAVGTLYGYLVNGRCTYIKGHGGIYDTYDTDQYRINTLNELRQIKNLNQEILANQQVLINEVQQIGVTVNSINNSINSISRDIADIKCSNAISAAANQQTAEHTRFMAWKMYNM